MLGSKRQALLQRKAIEDQKIAQARAAKAVIAEEKSKVAAEKSAAAKKLKDEAIAKAKAVAREKATKAKEAQALKNKELTELRLLHKGRVWMLREARFKINLELVEEKIEDNEDAEKPNMFERQKLADKKTSIEKEIARLAPMINQLAVQAHDLMGINLRQTIETEMKEATEKAERPRNRI